ncbi:MAG: FAD-dependent oxidoreductase [Magnetococcales bacterium]|nr:FAD-dependent oxidoreductase [Magnetococcales bacterium]
MSATHYVIIGNGVAGNQAAEVLRDRDPASRVTIVTNSRLLFYNRYLLPQVFKGEENWRAFLANKPDHYLERRIAVRRDCWVTHVDPVKRQVVLGHNEALHYDKLLVASGGRGHLPEELAEYKRLFHVFGSYEAAMVLRRALPEGGRVVMLGGDMIGLDLARNLLGVGYRVALVTGETTFWPHQVTGEERETFLESLTRMGIELLDGDALGGVATIEEGAPGLPARRVCFGNGSEIYGDVVMPFLGLTPSVEFMVGSGTDIERGLLVSTSLRTNDANIYAAGDVCQIWSAESHSYRFYYGHRNVRAMGAVAACNMTGGDEPFVSTQDEHLRFDDEGRVTSPFWEYD